MDVLNDTNLDCTRFRSGPTFPGLEDQESFSSVALVLRCLCPVIGSRIVRIHRWSFGINYCEDGYPIPITHRRIMDQSGRAHRCFHRSSLALLPPQGKDRLPDVRRPRYRTSDHDRHRNLFGWSHRVYRGHHHLHHETPNKPPLPFRFASGKDLHKYAHGDSECTRWSPRRNEDDEIQRGRTTGQHEQVKSFRI